MGLISEISAISRRVNKSFIITSYEEKEVFPIGPITSFGPDFFRSTSSATGGSTLTARGLKTCTASTTTSAWLPTAKDRPPTLSQATQRLSPGVEDIKLFFLHQ